MTNVTGAGTRKIIDAMKGTQYGGAAARSEQRNEEIIVSDTEDHQVPMSRLNGGKMMKRRPSIQTDERP
jgi:hypothetical protein